MLNKIRYIMHHKKSRYMDRNDITIEQLKIMQNNGALVIDVRNPLEYKEGHILGSICIPDYEIIKKINQYVSNKNKQIILYCTNGYRSVKAQKKLEKMGYTNVYNLYNGTQNY